MVQDISVAYRAPNTSSTQNSHLVGVVKAGVYSGYIPMISPSGGRYVDLHVEGAESVLRTQDGRTVRESATVSSAVKVRASDYAASRWDIIVAELVGSAQTYKIKEGISVYSGTPEIPEPTSTQTLLARIYVGASSSATLAQGDIYPAIPAGTTLPEERSSLRATILPGSQMVYISEGLTMATASASLQEFGGGTSEPISTTGLSTGVTYYWLIGIEGDGTIVLTSAVTAVEDLDELAQPFTVIARLTGRVVAASVQFDEVVDVLGIATSSGVITASEKTTYLSTLSSSLFKYLKIEDTPTEWLHEVIGGTLSSSTGRVSSTGSDVWLVTKDLLLETTVTDLNYLMVTADSTAPITYQVSTLSPSYGFGSQMALGDVSGIPASATRLYLKFKLDAAAFVPNTPILLSFGVFMNLLLPTAASTGDSLDNLKYTPDNLLVNGDFKYWDKPTASGLVPEPLDHSDAAYRVSTEDIYGPAGWQYTKQDVQFEDAVVTRVFVDGVPTLHSNILASTSGDIIMEQRVEASPLVGDMLTFSVDVS